MFRLFAEELGCLRLNAWFFAVLDTAGSPGAIALGAFLTMWCFSSKFSASFALFASTVVNTGIASFKSILFSPSVGSQESASAGWCLVPGLQTELRSNSNKRGRHRESFPDASGSFKPKRRAL